MLDEFEECARQVPHRAPVLDLVLNGTGRLLDETSPLDAAYWRGHARGTVRFAESIATLRARGMRVFLEVGPAPVLTGMARQCTGESEMVWLASLRKDREASAEMLSSLGALYALGLNPDWRAVEGGRTPSPPCIADLPFPAPETLAGSGARTNCTTADPPAGGDAKPEGESACRTTSGRSFSPRAPTGDPVPGREQEGGFAARLRAAAPADNGDSCRLSFASKRFEYSHLTPHSPLIPANP